MSLKLNLTGRTFGRLKVRREVGKNKQGSYLWASVCSCGRHVVVSSGDLVSRHTNSCGCYRNDQCRKAISRLDRQGEANGQSKLDEEAVRDIRQRVNSGVTHRELALEYAVNPSAISHVMTGRNWSHIQ